jgi:signal transduction histidine kinase
LTGSDRLEAPAATIPAIACGVLLVTAGMSLGATLAGGIAPAAGLVLAALAGSGSAATATATHLRSPRAGRPEPAGPIPEHPGAGSRSVRFEDLMGDLDDPAAMLGTVVEAAASSLGFTHALLFGLRDCGETLRLETPVVAAGRTRAGAEVTFPTGDGGPLRLALICGEPIAPRRSGDEGGAWRILAEDHGLDRPVLLPLRSGNTDGGVLVLGSPGVAPSDADLTRLREGTRGVSAAIATALRLRDHAETADREAGAARFRSDYASVISHELRTPLTTILGVLKTVSRPELAPEDPDARDLLGMAVAQGDRLRRLIEDMLAVTQIGASGVPVRPEVVDLRDLIIQAVDAVSGTEGLTETTLPDHLPPVILDREHTRRVLVNLLGNAVKHGHESPIAITVTASGEILSISIADRGPGLPADAAARAFEPFTQLRRREVDAHGGVGLGLSVARGLVEAMGGRIGHLPTPGGGATFVVTLPFKPYEGPPA